MSKRKRRKDGKFVAKTVGQEPHRLAPSIREQSESVYGWYREYNFLQTFERIVWDIIFGWAH